MTRVIQASQQDIGIRYDQFIQKNLSKTSRSQINKLIKNGHITLNGHLCKPSQLIVGHEQFMVSLPEIKPAHITPQNIPLDILFSDDHIAVINKPAGLVVHPGAGVVDGTLCHALLYYFPDMAIGNECRPGIVHRLDKETSGVMVVAKTQEAHQILSDDFKYRRVNKIYRAFCYGEFKDASFELKTGHVRHPHHRMRFFTNILPPKTSLSNVRLAHSSFQVLKNGFGLAELRVILHTGRSHQIRAHLADIGHPLVGDELYGGKRDLPKSAPAHLKTAVGHLNGQALHAESLAFVHPITKMPLFFSADLPAVLQKISQSL